MGIKFHRYSDVKPTAADADANGQVLARAGAGKFYCAVKWADQHYGPWNEWAALNEEPQFPHQAAREPQPYANHLRTLCEDFKRYYRYVPEDEMYFEFLVRVIRAVIKDEEQATWKLLGWPP